MPSMSTPLFFPALPPEFSSSLPSNLLPSGSARPTLYPDGPATLAGFINADPWISTPPGGNPYPSDQPTFDRVLPSGWGTISAVSPSLPAPPPPRLPQEPSPDSPHWFGTDPDPSWTPSASMWGIERVPNVHFPETLPRTDPYWRNHRHHPWWGFFFDHRDHDER